MKSTGRKSARWMNWPRRFPQPADHLVVHMIGDGPPLVLDRKKVEDGARADQDALQRVQEENLGRTIWRQNRPRHEKNLDAKNVFSSVWSGSWSGLASAKPLPAKNDSGVSNAMSQEKQALARAGERNRAVLRLFSAVAKEGAFLKARSGSGPFQRASSGDGGFGGQRKLCRAGAGGIGRKKRGQCSGNRLRSESGFARTDGQKISRRHHSVGDRNRYGCGRSARGVAIGTDRRADRDGGSGHYHSSDAIPCRGRAIPHLSIEPVDAISRKQLHRSAGQEEQARRPASALRSALATARRNPGTDHHSLF